MTRTRLLLIIPTLGVGGAEKLVSDICIHIDRKVFDVRVLTFFDAENQTFTKLVRNCGIQIDCLNKKPGFDFSMFGKLKKYFKVNKFDVINTHLRVIPYMLPQLMRAKTKCFHTVHTIAEKEASGVNLRAQKFAVKIGIIRLVSISSSVKNSVDKMYNVDSVLVNNGVDTAKFVCQRDYNRCDKIVCVGRLGAEKNHALAIDAFEKISKIYPDMDMDIYGQGELKDALQTKIDMFGLSERVKLRGVVSDMPSVFASSDIFLLTSKYEGFGLVACEAMGSGLPVVSTRNGGAENIVDDGIDGIFAVTRDEIVAAIVKLKEDSTLRESLGLNAIVKAKKFDIKMMTDGYSRLYLSDK